MGKLIYLVLEALTSLYWPLLPQMILESIWQNWHRQPASFVRGMLLVDAWCFFVPAESVWAGWAVKQLLDDYEIEMWGWGYAFETFFFHVHRDDAYFVEELLLSVGVPLT